MMKKLIAILILMIVAACSFPKGEAKYPEWDGGKDKYGKVTGEDGLVLFGGKDKKQEGGGGIGVNGFLWRASLDTVAFMPLVSADPFGGVIISDWYSAPEAQNERAKVTVYILGRELRSDGVKVSVFRQAKNEKGEWVDSEVAKETAANLENTILTRARQLRIQAAASE